MGVRNSFCILVMALAALPAAAKELEIRARAAVAAQGDPQAVRVAAEREARRRAVATAIEKVLGPGATRDPRVGSKLDAIVAQIADERVVESKGALVGDQYEVALTLVLDDKEFRTLLSDAGVAVNTAVARASSVLAVMDEFLTTPRDLHAPLEELEEFSSSKGGSFSAQASESSASSSSASSASASSARAAVAVSARGGEALVAGAQRSRAASTESASSSASSASSVQASAHDDVRYRKLVKYQPQNASPEKTSQAYAALVGQLQEYDLRVLDNDVFRSKYFKDAPLTLEQLQNGAELARYVGFAKAEGNADFFMVGTSIIIDAGPNANTGELECTGVVTVRTYAIADGEAIASDTFSEASTGRNTNDCAANVSKKLASVGGPVLGARIHDYWKRRQAYGREYVLTLRGASLPLVTRTVFSRAVKALPGVENDMQRASDDKRVQLVVTYKGSEPLDQALAMSLAEANPAFATLDSRTDGNQVTLCMGPCGSLAAADAQAGKGAP